MPINLRQREGDVFTDVILVGDQQQVVRGDQDHAEIALPDGTVITGKVKLSPTLTDGNRLARSYVFVSDSGQQYPFGEESLSAANKIGK